ncbi:MAG: hypothetical protein KHX46_09850, partial [Clostridiales bacterium]|nr:hypothetical protein [Clostridiales bacterium]
AAGTRINIVLFVISRPNRVQNHRKYVCRLVGGTSCLMPVSHTLLIALKSVQKTLFPLMCSWLSRRGSGWRCSYRLAGFELLRSVKT